MIKSTRLLSLDVMRGITIAGMIMVNNPGSWSSVYAPLRHVQWNGLTPTDLVFPFFMFIMGVSMDFSLRKYHDGFNREILAKILKRTCVIFAIGLFLSWFGNLCYQTFNIADDSTTWWQRLTTSAFSFSHLRIMGVMQRLALSYCGGAILSLIVKPSRFLWVAGGILIFYAILLFAGHGFIASPDNIIAIVDNTLFGANHMYREALPDGGSFPFDPEGLLSTLPCIPHVMFGMYAGRIIMNLRENTERIAEIFIFGTILLFTGCLLSYGIPVNKKIWSPTFVLITCGLASQFLSLLIWIIDMKKKKKWCNFFETFGTNPLFMYVLGSVLAILLDSIRIPVDNHYINLKSLFYQNFLANWLPSYEASLLYAVLFIGLNWLFGYQLYKRKIYIKI